MKRGGLAATTGLLVTVISGGVAAREQELGCDPSAIRWHVPGQFKAARERASKEKRLLIIMASCSPRASAALPYRYGEG